MEDRGDLVVERDPTHVLLAGTEPATDAELERQEHSLEDAALFREHETGAHAGDADACVRSGRGRVFPRDAHLRAEVAAGSVVFVEDLVAAVAVVTDRRRRYQHARLAREPGDRGREELGAARAALQHQLLALRRPLLVTDPRAREVHERVDALEAGSVDRARVGVPLHVVGTLRSAADQAQHPVPLGPEARDQRGPDQAVRSGQADVHTDTLTVRAAAG